MVVVGISRINLMGGEVAAAVVVDDRSSCVYYELFSTVLTISMKWNRRRSQPSYDLDVNKLNRRERKVSTV